MFNNYNQAQRLQHSSSLVLSLTRYLRLIQHEIQSFQNKTRKNESVSDIIAQRRSIQKM